VSAKRVPLAICEKVLGLYRERYYDLNIRHFHEKLKEEHGIELSYTWVQKALQGAGLISRRSKRGTHRRRRPRRPMTGMLLHIDGSKHCWFQNSQQRIPAYSPQARGRSERNFGTWQGRLPQELRLAGISTLETANRFLREHYIDVFNRKFTVTAEQKTSAFRRSGRSDLDWIFTLQTERTVAKDNTVTIGDRVWQIEKSRFRSTLAGCMVAIHEHLDGRVSLRFGPHVVGRFDSEGRPIAKTNKQERRGKGGDMETGENQKQVSSRSHTSLGISPMPRDSHFSTAPTTVAGGNKRKPKAAHAA
jgi:hypothetical protein